MTQGLTLRNQDQRKPSSGSGRQKWVYNVQCDGARVGVFARKAENAKDVFKKYNGWWNNNLRAWLFELDDAKKLAQALSKDETLIKSQFDTASSHKFIFWGHANNRSPGAFSTAIDVRLFNLRNQVTLMMVDGFDRVIQRLATSTLDGRYDRDLEVYLFQGKTPADVQRALARDAYIHPDEVYVNSNVFQNFDVRAWRDIPKPRLTLSNQDTENPKEIFDPLTDETDEQIAERLTREILEIVQKPLQTRKINPDLLTWAEAKYGLRSYQTEGVRFLLERSSALLADDMGLGKTRQSVVAARINRKHGVNVVIVPAYLTINWCREIKIVEPAAKIWAFGVLALAGKVQNYSGFEAGTDKPGWIIASYERMGRVLDTLRNLNLEVDSLIFDEAHFLKEPESLRTQKAFRLAEVASHRILLTGTPILNSVAEIYTLLSLSGHALSKIDRRAFVKTFGASKMDRRVLNQRISEWMLRRDKKELNLIGKQRLEFEIEGSTQFWDAYQKIERDPLSIGLVKIGQARYLLEKEKLKSAFDFIDQLKVNDKAIIFLNFKENAEEALLAAKMKGIKCVGFTGDHNVTYRQRCVDQFQDDPETKLIFITIDAGYSGWTLTKANWVFMISLPWTPSKLLQAEDRAYRLGQERLVNVAVFKVANTLDTPLWEMLLYKAQQAADVIENDEEFDEREEEKRVALEILAEHGFYSKNKEPSKSMLAMA